MGKPGEGVDLGQEMKCSAGDVGFEGTFLSKQKCQEANWTYTSRAQKRGLG